MTTNTSTADKVTTYNSAVAAASADPTADNLAAVSAAYAALPAASRGRAMVAALAGIDPTVLSDLLAAHNNLPTAASRVERRTVTDQEAAAVRRIIDEALSSLVDDVNAGVFDGDDGPDDFMIDVTLSAIGDVRHYVTEKLRIGGGKRTTHNVDPVDVVPAGSQIVCTYKGGNVVGVLNADNTVTIGDDTYPSLSKAAIAVTGQPTANGWVHWQHNGQKLAAIRDAN